MSGRDRTRQWRQRRGRHRSTDIAWVCPLPITFGEIDELARLHLLPGGRSDKAAVTEAVRAFWAQVDVLKK